MTLLGALVAELEALLEPLALAVDDPGWRDQLLFTLGVNTSEDADGLVHVLDEVVTLADRISALDAGDAPSFDAVAGALSAAGDAFAAVDGLGADTIGPSVRGLTATLIQLLVGARLAARAPLLFRLLELLTVVEPAVDAPATDPVISGDDVLRLPVSITRIHPHRLVDLLQDPAALLMAEYGNELASIDQAAEAADRLFPRIANVLTELDVPSTYGLDAGQRSQLADAAPLLEHALTVFLQQQEEGAPADVGVLLSFSSADQGDLGLVASPFGAVSFTRDAGDWTFAIDLGAEVDAVAYGRRQGLTLVAGTGAVEVDATFSATLNRPADGTPTIIGSPTGSRLEIGSAKITASASLSQARQELAFAIDLSPGALVIAPGDSDSFLASLLPPDGLRTDFDLGIAWSSATGITVKGGANLDATIPVGRTVAGVTLSSVHVGIDAHSGRLTADVSLTLGASIGPVRVLVDRLGLQGQLTMPESDDGSGTSSGNLGIANLDLGLKTPSGIGLVIDIDGVLTGGGALILDPGSGTYFGAMQLALRGGVTIKAFAVITTHAPGYSLLIFLTAEGFEPIPLGMGFTLTGIGGLVAINRTVDADAVRAGLGSGLLDSVLFVKDPVGNADRVLATVNQVFPVAPGRLLVGPLVEISWGSPTLVTMRVAVLLDLPRPVRAIVLAAITAKLPRPEAAVVELHVDAIGVLDLGKGTLALDASLHDSRILSFPISGDLALRLDWGGADPSFLLSVGGFHPRFTPPAGLRPLKRVSVMLTTGNTPQVRFEAYLAVTSNTLQMGARASIKLSTSGFGVEGGGSFDALIQWSPFELQADLAAWVKITAGGDTLLSLQLELHVTGPTPWHLTGKATISVLWWDIDIPVDLTVGSSAAAIEPVDVADIAALVWDVVRQVSAWQATLPAGRTTGATVVGAAAQDRVLAHPLSVLSARQKIAPLDTEISRLGTRLAKGGPGTYHLDLTVGAGLHGTATTDLFSPAQFNDLPDDQALAAPSFEPMSSGWTISPVAASSSGPSTPCLAVVDTIDVTDLDRPGAAGGVAEALTTGGA